jgi:hypothetical protein
VPPQHTVTMAATRSDSEDDMSDDEDDDDEARSKSPDQPTCMDHKLPRLPSVVLGGSTHGVGNEIIPHLSTRWIRIARNRKVSG